MLLNICKEFMPFSANCIQIHMILAVDFASSWDSIDNNGGEEWG